MPAGLLIQRIKVALAYLDFSGNPPKGGDAAIKFTKL
jgi:hypothetical protein